MTALVGAVLGFIICGLIVLLFLVLSGRDRY